MEYIKHARKTVLDYIQKTKKRVENMTSSGVFFASRCLGVICQRTRDSVSLGYPNTEYDAQWSIFDEIRGVWIAN